MTRDVITIQPEDTLDVVAQIFEQYDFDGIPVVERDKKLVGIITAYDMIVQSSGMHLPTVLNIIKKIAVDRGDRRDLEAHFAQLKQVKAKQMMNSDPLTVSPDDSVEELASDLAEHHRVNPILVVDSGGKLVGVVSRYDVIRFFNQSYFHKVLRASGSQKVLAGLARTGVERNLGKTVSDISNEYVLVTKKRPFVLRILIVVAFIVGFIVATAFIIRIVRRPAEYKYIGYNPAEVPSTAAFLG